MTKHALDAMIYAWMVMKEKEESSMEGIYVGKVKRSVINKDDVNLLFIDHRQDIHHLSEVIDYEDTAYCLVPTNDIIINNDELLKLREQVKKLEKAFTAIQSKRESLDIQNESLKEAIDSLKNKIKRLEDDNAAKADALILAKDRGDYWVREHAAKAIEYQELERKHDAKWSAMTEALKDKGVEVIYMGEEDGKPCVDVKVPEIDILRKDFVTRGQELEDLRKEIEDLRKEIEDLKSKKVAACTLEAGADGRLKFIYTYMDGHNEPANVDYLCKNYVDAESISHGTVPKCSSCAHHMHRPSLLAHDWCYIPVSKEGPGTMRKLNKEESEGPGCSYFKPRKEADCKDCKYHETAFWRVSIDGEGMAACRSPKTKYGFCRNNCGDEKACPGFEAKE